MHLLVYASVLNEDWVRLGDVLEQNAPRESVEIYRRVATLRDRLARPLQRPAVLVMLAATTQELAGLVELAKLSYDLKVILVLPDRSLATLRTAQKLSPSFYTYMDGDFSDLGYVLQHIFGYCPYGSALSAGSMVPPGEMTLN